MNVTIANLPSAIAERELFDLGVSYYRICRIHTRMDAALFHAGNRTDRYRDALGTIGRVRDYLWDSIRATVVYYAIAGDPILEKAWHFTRGESGA